MRSNRKGKFVFDSEVDSSFIDADLEQLAEKHLPPDSVERFYHCVNVCDFEMARIILFANVDRRFLLNAISFEEASEAWDVIDLSPKLVSALRAPRPKPFMA